MTSNTIQSLIEHINDKKSGKELKKIFLENLRNQFNVNKLKFGKILCTVMSRQISTTSCDLCGYTFKSPYLCIRHQIVDHSIPIPYDKMKSEFDVFNADAENDYECEAQPGPSTSRPIKRNLKSNNQLILKKRKYDEHVSSGMFNVKNLKERLIKVDPEMREEWNNDYSRITTCIKEILNTSKFMKNRRKYINFLKHIHPSKDTSTIGDSLFQDMEIKSCNKCHLCNREFKQPISCAVHLLADHHCNLKISNEEDNYGEDEEEYDDDNDDDDEEDDDEDGGEEEEDEREGDDMQVKKIRGIVNNSTPTTNSVRNSGKLIPPATINLNKEQCAGYVKNIHSPQIYEELKRDVDGSNFSLIVNGLINLDNQKISVVFIRYFSKKRKMIVTAFYRLIAMPFERHLINFIKNDGLKTKYFLGFGIDSESMDIGEIESISTYLRREVPNIFINKYIYNTLLYIIVNSGKCFPGNLMWIIKETYKWFNKENRMNIYKNVYQLIMIENLKNFFESPDDHWLYFVKGIQLISDNWDQLLDHFKTIKQEENDYITTILYEQYEKSLNKLFFEFIHKSLNSLIELENEFQTHTEYYSSELFERLNSLCNDFQSSLENNLECDYDKSIAKEEEFLSTCQEFSKILEKKLKNLMSGDSLILGKVSCFLQNNTTINDVIALIERFPHISDGNKVADEWFFVKTLGSTSMETIECIKRWLEISKINDEFGTFENVSQFALSLLCLPVSSTETKCVYSIINKINNEINIKKTTEPRNIFSVSMLEALLRYYYVPALIFIERMPSTAGNNRIEGLTEGDIATYELVDLICRNSNKE